MNEQIENTSDIVLYSYSDDSSYVSSTTKYTPFPSLTAIEKQRILDICSNNIEAVAKPVVEEKVVEDEQIELRVHGCCCIA